MDEIIKESEETLELSLNSVTKSSVLTKDIKQIGSATLEKLYKQGAQIERVDSKIDDIEDDVETSKYYVRSIGSVLGVVRNKLFGKKKKKSNTQLNTQSNTQSNIQSNIQSKSNTHHNINPDLLNHLSEKAQNDQKEIECNLNILSKDLDDIRYVALSIGTEIHRHNNMLDNVSPKVIECTESVKKVSRRTKRLN